MRSLRFHLPEIEAQALERVARAGGWISGDLPTRAIDDWIAAGSPALVGFPIARLDTESLFMWRIVTWWLRRSPGLDVLAPAALEVEAQEAAARASVRDAFAAQMQLGRIAVDTGHPQRADAQRRLMAMIPEESRGAWNNLFEAALYGHSFAPRVGKA